MDGEGGVDEVTQKVDVSSNQRFVADGTAVVQLNKLSVEFLNSLGDTLELSFLFSKSSTLEFSQSLSLFDFFIGILDSIGHGESLFKDGVNDEFVVASPLSSIGSELGNSLFSIFLEVGLQISSKVRVVSSEELSEEDETDFLINVESNIGIFLLDSLEFKNKLLNQQRESKFVSDVVGWDKNSSWDFLLNDLFSINSNNSLSSGKSVELEQEFLDDFDNNSQVGVGCSQLSEFNQKDLQLLLGVSVKFSVSSFSNLEISSNSDTKSINFFDFVNIFQNLNNLRKDDDSFNYLFKDFRNLNNLFDSGIDWHFFLFESINNLHFSFNVVNSVGDFLELFDSHSLFLDSWNFLYLSIS